jgi:hypothetical protein
VLVVNSGERHIPYFLIKFCRKSKYRIRQTIAYKEKNQYAAIWRNLIAIFAA